MMPLTPGDHARHGWVLKKQGLYREAAKKFMLASTISVCQRDAETYRTLAEGCQKLEIANGQSSLSVGRSHAAP